MQHSKFGVQAKFFQKLREGSLVKQKIVTEYFVAYNRVMDRNSPKVGYADLFAGPGVYTAATGDSHKSIPVLVCEQVVSSELFRDRVHLWFNEGDPPLHKQLEIAVNSVPGLNALRYKPVIDNKVVDASWAAKLRKLRVPTLVFLDPCGYKGLSLNLVTSALSGFGNDCIFFFNYSRINMKLDLDVMTQSINEFFEPARANALRSEIQTRSAAEREELILAAVKSAIEGVGAIPLTFRFRADNGRISHHLVYGSKNANAVKMMKRILNSASTVVTEGVGSGEHNPRSRNASGSLFAGLYEVEERLLSVFGSRKVSFGDLLHEESRTKYTDSNYRDAVLKLESEGRVKLDPPAEARRFQAGGSKRTLPIGVIIQFGE